MNKPAGMGSSFTWLNATQSLGALNDNIFKLLVIFFAIAFAGPEKASQILGIGGAIFVLPFLLFTAGSGSLADRLSKRNIIVAAKVLEVVVMALGLLAFLQQSTLALYGVLFLMSTQSALFGPSKYGIVPELVHRDQLSKANSLLVMYTYLAIILGSACAPLLAEASHSHFARAQTVCVVIAVIGTLASFFIKRTEPSGSTKGTSVMFWMEVWRTLQSIKTDRYLLQAVLASAYFTLLGAYLQLNMIPYGMQHLGLTQERSAYLFFVAAIGIAAGAWLAGKLSGRNIEFGIVPLGAVILTGSVMTLNFVSALPVVLLMVLLSGLGAGMFIVPLDAFIQFKAPAQQRGEILAAASFLGWTGVLVSSGLVLLNGAIGMTAGQGFILMGILTLALTLVTFFVLPDFFLRFVGLIITRLAYKIRVIGAEHVPIDGPALLVCNHASYMDALLLLATQQRRVRFIMDRGVYDSLRLIHPFLRLMGIIPISTRDNPKKIVESLRATRAVLDDGYMVCIFAEGMLTRTGTLREFKRGFERIVKGTTIPIIPVYLGGAWGSIASYYHGQLVRHWPSLLRYPVTVLFGKPLPSTTSAGEVRQAVMELSVDYFNDRLPRRRSLREEFVRTARKRWFAPAMKDTTGKKLSYGHALTGALVLGRRLEQQTAGQEYVGILLPPGVGGVLANLAVSLMGKVPVNLNFTSSEASLRSAISQCEIRTILTAAAFLERFPALKTLEGLVLLEEIMATVTEREKRAMFVKALLMPRKLLTRAFSFKADDQATVIFSSGSTGEPKGVMLSHHNILSNIESLRMVFGQAPTDHLCAALPLFHSLGYTATFWYPLLSGLPVTYHTNPLDAAQIAQIVRKNRATMLFATPTFLALYLRKAEAEDFKTLKYVVVGAEKMKPRLAEAFETKFGVHPLEGYGATELSPVATLSIPHVTVGGVTQAGWKEGSVGMPLPGVAMKIVDPDTGASLPTGEKGLLLIKGPNVMLGYLKRPDLTAEAIQDGWYRTGDMAMMDGEGFVVITDRLSRFSKIGGEMVPHLAVEEEFHRLLEKAEQVLAVTSVPDEKKGERLVVLFTPEAGTAESLKGLLEQCSLPNLWKPSHDSFFPIEKLPLLGSGKMDLKELKSIAQQRSTQTDTTEAKTP
ncbi:MAG: acyl-[ACP]--phospholipid O-acyltransferase [Lentisphaerota bacterium]